MPGFVAVVFLALIFIGVVVGGVGVFISGDPSYLQESKDFISFGLSSICLGVFWIGGACFFTFSAKNMFNRLK